MQNASEHPAVEAVHMGLREVDECLEAIDRLQGQLGEAKRNLQYRVVALAAIDDKNERLRAIRHLYWYERRANASALAAALLIEWDAEKNCPKHPVSLDDFTRYNGLLRKLVGPAVWVTCSTQDCDEKAPIESRAALDQWEKAGRPSTRHGFYCEYCAPCPVRAVPTKNWRAFEADRAKQLSEQEQGCAASEKRTAGNSAP
jgi:hypothetical protein